MRHRKVVLLATAFALGTAGAFAQTPVPKQQPPNMPPLDKTIPEKIAPQEPSTTGSTGQTLSDKLGASDGVIRPPAGVDPGIDAPAPVPNPGTTPVIPPPGSPGGNPQIVPK